jgi:hypothetical protein
MHAYVQHVLLNGGLAQASGSNELLQHLNYYPDNGMEAAWQFKTYLNYPLVAPPTQRLCGNCVTHYGSDIPLQSALLLLAVPTVLVPSGHFRQVRASDTDAKPFRYSMTGHLTVAAALMA